MREVLKDGLKLCWFCSFPGICWQNQHQCFLFKELHAATLGQKMSLRTYTSKCLFRPNTDQGIFVGRECSTNRHFICNDSEWGSDWKQSTRLGCHALHLLIARLQSEVILRREVQQPRLFEQKQAYQSAAFTDVFWLFLTPFILVFSRKDSPFVGSTFFKGWALWWYTVRCRKMTAYAVISQWLESGKHFSNYK